MTLSDRFSKPHDTMLRAGEDEEVDGLALMEPNLPARTGRPRGNLALMEGRQGGRELFLNFVSNLFVGHVQMAVNQQSAQERMCKSKKFYLLPESHPSVPFCFVLMTIEECKINMISSF